MRKLTDHKLSDLNNALDIQVLDDPGPGGASHQYQVLGFNTFGGLLVHFQKGAVKDVGGVNGISDECLLAIVIDRLRGFQAGPFCCRENSLALIKTQEALMWLQSRTRDRMARGVEGKSVK